MLKYFISLCSFKTLMSKLSVFRVVKNLACRTPFLTCITSCKYSYPLHDTKSHVKHSSDQMPKERFFNNFRVFLISVWTRFIMHVFVGSVGLLSQKERKQCAYLFNYPIHLVDRMFLIEVKF